jgi:hypothetical protein
MKRIATALSAASVLAHAAPAAAQDSYDDTGSDRERARAGSTQVAVDFDFGAALDEPGIDQGGGGAIRVGQKFDLLLLSLTPEAGGSYHAFSGDAGSKIYSGFLGGKLGIGAVVQPSIFAHLGVAHLDAIESRTAPKLDGGLALDFTLIPLIDLGVHGGYNVMFPSSDQESLSWLTFGAHAALVL